MRNPRVLYRPVGLSEAVKILESKASAFPPRLPEQPIFYPVLTRDYAEQITQQWNVPSASAGYAGFVTEFHLEAKYASKFKAQVVGPSTARELWVSAEELDTFNRHLVGTICLISAHYGEGYFGPTPLPYMLKGRTAHEQLPLLASILDYNGMDFVLEIRANRLVVRLNFAYWVRTNFEADGLPNDRKIVLLRDIRRVWQEAFSDVELVGSEELDMLAAKIT